MLRIYESEGTDIPQQLRSQWQPDGALTTAVGDIIERVRTHGDAAVLELTQLYDQHPATSMAELVLDRDHFQHALERLSSDARSLLQQTIARIESFHNKQLESSYSMHDEWGNRMGQRVSPLARAGLYTPGGKAAYPTSLIMNAVPAKVAGVGSLTVCSPAPKGELSPIVPALAGLLGVERLVTIGGAQAVAALTFGTESIPRVDKITGPGNAWVAEAKRQVYGQVGLDMVAGPSEIVIISDGSVPPELVLADLCAQAEHDTQARALLLTTSQEEAQSVQKLAQKQHQSQPRGAIIAKAFADHGGIIVCRSLTQTVDLANALAPEHLEILTVDPNPLVEQLHTAGAIFIGKHTCETFGDYCAGPNHVLPTAGSARFASPLGVYDFIKRTTVLECTQQGAHQLAALAVPLAKMEGLYAHSQAAQLRVDPTPKG